MLPDPKIVNHKLYAQLYDVSFVEHIKNRPWLSSYEDAHFCDSAYLVGATDRERYANYSKRMAQLQAEALRIGREMLDD